MAGFGMAGSTRNDTLHQFLNLYFNANVSRVIQAATDNQYDVEELTKALNMYVALIDCAQTSQLEDNRDDVLNAFMQGKIGFTIQGPWIVEMAKKSNLNIGIAPIPTVNGTPSNTLLIVDALVVFEESKHKELAQSLALFLTQNEQQRAFNKTAGFLPFFPEPQNDTQIQVFIELMNTAFPEPTFVDYLGYQETSISVLRDIISAKSFTSHDVEKLSAAVNNANRFR